MGRVWFIPLIIALLIGLLAGYYFLSAPRLLSFAPADKTTSNPAGTQIHLTFSRKMDPDSVSSRLKIMPAHPGSITWQGNTMTYRPEQHWNPGQTISVSLEAGARPASHLSAPLGEGASWSFSIRQPLVSYLYPTTGEVNIYVIDPATSAKQQLTAETGGILDYDIDQDRYALYYSTLDTAGGSFIYRLDLRNQNPNFQNDEDGLITPGSPSLILECPKSACLAPRVSPNGTYLAYEKTSSAFPQVWYLVLEDNRTGDPRLAGEEDHQTLLPQWSPEGLLTFYDKNLSAFIILDPVTGEKTSFPNQTGEAGSWHPDGFYYTTPEITFVSSSTRSNSGLETLAVSHLIRFNLSEKSSLSILPDEYVEDTYPAYSPDGGALAFSRKYLDDSSWTPGRQIWILPEGETTAVQYTFNPNFHHYDFAWSPDSSRLAYTRIDQTHLTEPPEIWIMDPENGISEQLLKGGFSPGWIP